MIERVAPWCPYSYLFVYFSWWDEGGNRTLQCVHYVTPLIAQKIIYVKNFELDASF